MCVSVCVCVRVSMCGGWPGSAVRQAVAVHLVSEGLSLRPGPGLSFVGLILPPLISEITTPLPSFLLEALLLTLCTPRTPIWPHSELVSCPQVGP